MNVVLFLVAGYLGMAGVAFIAFWSLVCGVPIRLYFYYYSMLVLQMLAYRTGQLAITTERAYYQAAHSSHESCEI